jgi:hypothetical protein
MSDKCVVKQMQNVETWPQLGCRAPEAFKSGQLIWWGDLPTHNSLRRSYVTQSNLQVQWVASVDIRIWCLLWFLNLNIWLTLFVVCLVTLYQISSFSNLPPVKVVRRKLLRILGNFIQMITFLRRSYASVMRSECISLCSYYMTFSSTID